MDFTLLYFTLQELNLLKNILEIFRTKHRFLKEEDSKTGYEVECKIKDRLDKIPNDIDLAMQLIDFKNKFYTDTAFSIRKLFGISESNDC